MEDENSPYSENDLQKTFQWFQQDRLFCLNRCYCWCGRRGSNSQHSDSKSQWLE